MQFFTKLAQNFIKNIYYIYIIYMMYINNILYKYITIYYNILQQMKNFIMKNKRYKNDLNEVFITFFYFENKWSKTLINIKFKNNL